ncbi:MULTISPECIES: TOBE domain-containing protein [Piscinibacter]|uniref:TOBE domain-containing protein n=1 Tax=Piscinibacter defluvii TaxID=1796922 RepID=UPI001F0CA50E|nr:MULTISPECIES: TOBE domain-containing protein [Piscinibacter]
MRRAAVAGLVLVRSCALSQRLEVASVITTRSVKELGLTVGKEVIALVKSTEVSIATL